MRYVLKDREKVGFYTPYQLEMILWTGENVSDIEEFFYNNKSIKVVDGYKDYLKIGKKYDQDLDYSLYLYPMVGDYIGYDINNKLYIFPNYEFDELYKLDMDKLCCHDHIIGEYMKPTQYQGLYFCPICHKIKYYPFQRINHEQ